MSSVAGARDALLIATGAYRDKRLKRLRSPVQDAKELAAVLEDPMIGSFKVDSVLNKRHFEVAQSIERFFQNRSSGDLLLVHFSCHGIKDGDGLLHFAATDTNPDLPASTSVSAEFLRNQLQRSRAKSVILLLDCCYSGSFLTGMKGGDQAVDLREELAGHGRAIITATNRTEYAWEGQNIIEFEPESSQFTGAVVKGLRTGEADLDGDGKIAIDELYEYVYELLHRAKVRQTPRKWVDLEYQVFIASSPRSALRVSGSRRESAPNPKFKKYRTQRGVNETIRVELSLTETAFGTLKDLSFQTWVRCNACGATGNASREMPAICSKCTGTGIEDRHVAKSLPCQECKGFGTFLQDPCLECDSEGRVQIKRAIRVRIPKGVEHGSLIELAGEGPVGTNGGPPSDVFLEVIELRDPRFERRGDDLYTTATIPSSLAATGGTFEVETLEGRKNIRIPPGQTKDGTLVQVAGEGVPHLNYDSKSHRWLSDKGRGSLMVKISVT